MRSYTLIIYIALCVVFLRDLTFAQGSLPIISKKLYNAAKDGDEAFVTYSIKKNPKLVLSKYGSFQSTLLHVSSLNRHVNICELLLQHGADVNATDKSGSTPGYWVAQSDDTAVMKVLLKYICKKDTFPSDNELLRVAVRWGNKDMVRILAYTNCLTRNNNSAHYTSILGDAISRGFIEIVEILLNSGEDPNKRDKYGFTPLDEAVRGKNLYIFDLLVSKGATINSKNKFKKSSVFETIETDDDALLDSLTHRGAVTDTSQNITLLLEAIKRHSNKISKYLIEHNFVSVDLSDGLGNTPLHIAVEFKNIKAISLLLEKNAKTDVKNVNGKSPTDLATDGGDMLILLALTNASNPLKK